jgi:microsomal dipeptidase-like Zn-dependent dipeptidase
VSEQTWRDVLAEGVPFSVAQAGCRGGVRPPAQPRRLAPEALAERGGVVGMMAIPFMVHHQVPTFSRWLEHFDHAVA